MPNQPFKSIHFDSLEKLRAWLPEASESQLITVFVWTSEQAPPPGDAGQLAQVRREVFERLVGRVRDRLKAFLIQRCQCQDVHLADDVVQQVLIKLYLRAEQYDPRRSFWGWLYRIARNDYIDTLRRLRPGAVGVGQTGGGDEDLERWLGQGALAEGTPESDLLAKERQQQLEAAIAALPRLQQDVVQLRRHGVAGKEIAQRLSISPAYVSQLYHEAEEELRTILER